MTKLPPLDKHICQQARLARDGRFDGRFFTAVTSTGIYCRPICPVSPPRECNVCYYPSAVAAEAAGFRPCLRCRPEAAPGSPAWQGTAATVTRALRLIDEGALDQDSVETLAARLGVGARYLRKLFTEQVGASPSAVAQSRRLHLAKRLLDETSLSMTQIALAAGFSSVRRFNAAFLQTYQRPPGQLRRRAAPVSPVIDLRLRYRPPWHWAQFRDFFAQRALAGIEVVNEAGYQRSFRYGAISGWYCVRPTQQAALQLQVSSSALALLPKIIRAVRQQFDLDADPLLIDAHLRADPQLAVLIARNPAQRLPAAFDPFEQAVRTIVGQQITVKAAVTVLGRLVEQLGAPLHDAPNAALSRVFPTPEALASADPSGFSMPRKRAHALRDFAAKVAEGRLSLHVDQGCEALLQTLCAQPGIGPWSAQYIALRAFAEPDAFPCADLGLLKSSIWQGHRLTARQLDARAQAWRPWRAYAATYLWSAYDL